MASCTIDIEFFFFLFLVQEHGLYYWHINVSVPLLILVFFLVLLLLGEKTIIENVWQIILYQTNPKKKKKKCLPVFLFLLHNYYPFILSMYTISKKEMMIVMGFNKYGY